MRTYVKGTIKVLNRAAQDALVKNTNKKVIFKNCARFTSYITKINNTQEDNAEDIDIVMPMYSLIEHISYIIEYTSGSLWQYYRDETALDNNDNIIDFCINDKESISFGFKQQITGQTRNDGIRDVEIIVPLKYLGNFWRTLEMFLINCEVSLQLTCSKKVFSWYCSKSSTKFTITDTKLYVPVINLLTEGNTKLLKRLESGFKRTINWNKYQFKKKVKLKTDI